MAVCGRHADGIDVHPLCAWPYPRWRSRLRRRLRAQRGFTLLELVAASAVLLVGVLGTMTMVDGASRTTQKNAAREAATTLSRELVDVLRALPYQQVTSDALPAALQTRPELADSSPAAGWTIGRRGRTFAVSVSACAIDDPKDGIGSHNVAVAFCPEVGPSGTKDRNADDYRRVTVTLAWSDGGASETNRQAAIVTNPAGGLGPTVSELTLSAPVVGDPSSPTITDAGATQATFAVKLTNTPASVTWAIDGDVQGDATGSGTSWTATWQLAGWEDGSYTVQAQGFDAEGRSGAARKLPVVLNRTAPPAPGGFDGGRNGNGSHVDLEWLASGEGDVVGYRVYRVDAAGNRIERACPPAGGGGDAYLTATACIDEAAPAGGPLHYAAVALDLDPGGALREGPQTAVKQIVEGNTVPTTPLDLLACSGGTLGCLLGDGSAAPSGTTVVTWSAALDLDLGDSIRFYRVYRDGSGYGDRYGRVYASAGLLTLTYVDTAPGSTSHTYRVTAVDERYGESPHSLGVTK